MKALIGAVLMLIVAVGAQAQYDYDNANTTDECYEAYKSKPKYEDNNCREKYSCAKCVVRVYGYHKRNLTAYDRNTFENYLRQYLNGSTPSCRLDIYDIIASFSEDLSDLIDELLGYRRPTPSPNELSTSPYGEGEVPRYNNDCLKNLANVRGGCGCISCSLAIEYAKCIIRKEGLSVRYLSALEIFKIQTRLQVELLKLGIYCVIDLQEIIRDVKAETTSAYAVSTRPPAYTTKSPYQPPTTEQPYQPPTTQPPYYPPTTQPPYQPPTTQPPYQPPTTQPPYQPPTTQPPYYPPTTQPPYQPPTTQPPYQPPTTQPPYQPPTTQPPYQPPTTQQPYQPPTTQPPNQPTTRKPYQHPTPPPYQYPTPPPYQPTTRKHYQYPTPPPYQYPTPPPYQPTTRKHYQYPTPPPYQYPTPPPYQHPTPPPYQYPTPPPYQHPTSPPYQHPTPPPYRPYPGNEVCVDNNPNGCRGVKDGDYQACFPLCQKGYYITCSNEYIFLRECALGFYGILGISTYRTVYDPYKGRCERSTPFCPRDLDDEIYSRK